MSESLTHQWRVTKQPIRGKGVVVAQNCRAAEVGVEILRKGGNAIDAAVATGMAIGTVEPWMSGIDVAGRLAARWRPRAVARLASQCTLLQARQSRQDLPTGERRWVGRIL